MNYQFDRSEFSSPPSFMKQEVVPHSHSHLPPTNDDPIFPKASSIRLGSQTNIKTAAQNFEDEQYKAYTNKIYSNQLSELSKLFGQQDMEFSLLKQHVQALINSRNRTFLNEIQSQDLLQTRRYQSQRDFKKKNQQLEAKVQKLNQALSKKEKLTYEPQQEFLKNKEEKIDDSSLLAQKNTYIMELAGELQRVTKLTHEQKAIIEGLQMRLRQGDISQNQSVQDRDLFSLKNKYEQKIQSLENDIKSIRALKEKECEDMIHKIDQIIGSVDSQKKIISDLETDKNQLQRQVWSYQAELQKKQEELQEKNQFFQQQISSLNRQIEKNYQEYLNKEYECIELKKKYEQTSEFTEGKRSEEMHKQFLDYEEQIKLLKQNSMNFQKKYEQKIQELRELKQKKNLEFKQINQLIIKNTKLVQSQQKVNQEKQILQKQNFKLKNEFTGLKDILNTSIQGITQIVMKYEPQSVRLGASHEEEDIYNIKKIIQNIHEDQNLLQYQFQRKKLSYPSEKVEKKIDIEQQVEYQPMINELKSLSKPNPELFINQSEKASFKQSQASEQKEKSFKNTHVSYEKIESEKNRFISSSSDLNSSEQASSKREKASSPLPKNENSLHDLDRSSKRSRLEERSSNNGSSIKVDSVQRRSPVQIPANYRSLSPQAIGKFVQSPPRFMKPSESTVKFYQAKPPKYAATPIPQMRNGSPYFDKNFKKVIQNNRIQITSKPRIDSNFDKLSESNASGIELFQRTQKTCQQCQPQFYK